MSDTRTLDVVAQAKLWLDFKDEKERLLNGAGFADRFALALVGVEALLIEQREALDGPSGLREQFAAARKGEQIEHRLRAQAEALLIEQREARQFESAFYHWLDKPHKVERLEELLSTVPDVWKPHVRGLAEQREALEARDRLFTELYAKPHRAEEIAARYAALSRLEASKERVAQ